MSSLKTVGVPHVQRVLSDLGHYTLKVSLLLVAVGGRQLFDYFVSFILFYNFRFDVPAKIYEVWDERYAFIADDVHSGIRC